MRAGGKIQDIFIAGHQATAAELMLTSTRRYYETAKESRLSLIYSLYKIAVIHLYPEQELPI